MKDFIEFPLLPITKETFERQGWEEYTENEGYDEEGNSIKYTYYILPLPKDNPEEKAPILISSADDEWEELGIKKGEFYVEIANFYGLGLCTTEEELEILYRTLTKQDLEPEIN